MLNLLGEYDCNLDAKGRIMFPAKLRKQLEEVLHHGLVVNRDLHAKCLVIYPKPEWDKMYEDISSLSRLNPRLKEFRRLFMAGATHLDIDSAGRVLLPVALLEHAGLDTKSNKNLLVVGMGETVEIWRPDLRKDSLNVSEDDYNELSALADEYLERAKANQRKTD